MDDRENHRAAYIGELSQELAEMARTDGLELLAYLLEMANLEAESTRKQSHDRQHG
jgi:hypothetical protein